MKHDNRGTNWRHFAIVDISHPHVRSKEGPTRSADGIETTMALAHRRRSCAPKIGLSEICVERRDMSRIRLWIGSSSENIELAEAVLGQFVNLPEYECEIWDQDTFGFGEGTLESLEDKVNDSDFVIMCLGPDDVVESRGTTTDAPRDNVLFELGLFMGGLGRRRAIALYQSDLELKIPSDLHGIKHARYQRRSGETLDKAVRPTCHTLKTHFRRLGPRGDRHSRYKRDRRVEVILERGDSHALDFVADAVLYLGQERHKYATELRRYISTGQPIPAKFLYVSPAGSQHWIDLCNRREYGFYRDSLRHMNESVPSIVQTLTEHAKSREFDLVSLGSGDGRKDLGLLRRLTGQVQQGESIYYYPIEISDSLILTSIQNATSPIRADRIEVKGVLGDFLQLRRFSMIYEYRRQPNIFSVLGNTFGNTDELALTEAIANSLQEGDFLLLEVNVGDAAETLKTAEESVPFAEHDFTPLVDLRVPYDRSSLKYSIEEGLSFIRGTKTVVARYDQVHLNGTVARDVCLSLIHHYEFDSLVKEIEERMNVETLWRNQSGEVGVVLARRPTDKS